MAGTRPPDNGVSITTAMGGFKATGPSALWLLGFAVVAAAVIYSNFQIRNEIRASISQQTADIHHMIQAQTDLFKVITSAMSTTSEADRQAITEVCRKVAR
jgi:hypothetical protein